MKMKCAAVIEKSVLLSRAAVSTASRDRFFQIGNARFDPALPAPAQQNESEQ